MALTDTRDHIERLSFDATFVEETNVPHFEQQEGRRVFSVNVPEHEASCDIQMIKYSCCSSLRPVPFLVQGKVRIAGRFCRVGVKIRANPSNKKSLENMAILLPVPPDIRGDTAKMSRRGGTWDAMKRIITWTVSEVQCGETVEMESQFEFVSGEKNPFPPKFPVLVRCDAVGDQLSGVKVDLIASDESPVSTLTLDLGKAFRVLHRKL